jgi:hypothetical protein
VVASQVIKAVLGFIKVEAGIWSLLVSWQAARVFRLVCDTASGLHQRVCRVQGFRAVQ